MRRVMFGKSFRLLLLAIFSLLCACSSGGDSDEPAFGVADFDFLPVVGEPNKIIFISKASGSYQLLEWDFGNGHKVENKNEVIMLYPLKGEYQASLSIWNRGQEIRKTKSITITQDLLTVNIEAVPTVGNKNIISLNAQISGSYQGLEWSFRNKTVKDKLATEAWFPFAGTQSVKLTVFVDGFAQVFTKDIVISGDDPNYIGQLSLVWADEFDGVAVNRDHWVFETGATGWGNNELQNYTDGTNASVVNGKLIITARHDGYGSGVGSYTSSRMITKGKKEFTYGRMEIRAKLPGGKGIWPAIWMLGSNINAVGWPACGEIDIMEYVGKDPGVVHSSIHTQSFNHSIGTQKTKSYSLPDAETAFHNYGVIWTEKSMKFYIDEPDNIFFTFNKEGVNDTGKWPFDKPCFFILNIAVGGNWGGEVDNAIFPQTMEIDYVRVYQE